MKNEERRMMIGIMSSRWTAWWRSAYPAAIPSWKVVVVPAVIVFFVLYGLQPFGIAQITSGKLWVTLGAAGISAAVSSLFAWGLPHVFPRYYAEEHWTLGKEVLSTLELLLLITVGVWLYVAWLTGMMPDVRLFFLVLLWVLILSVFPIVLFAMWNRNIQLARHLREATEMNQRLPVQSSPETDAICPTEPLLFAGSTKETLEVDASLFLYAEAEGNYVHFHYLSSKDNRPIGKLVRLTMKQAEAAVDSCPYVIRCHRAFLVNLHRVTKVDGNLQGYRLRLEGCGAEVPVSRAYAKAVKKLMKNEE